MVEPQSRAWMTSWPDRAFVIFDPWRHNFKQASPAVPLGRTCSITWLAGQRASEEADSRHCTFVQYREECQMPE